MRLIIYTGKGGTGKTVTACSTALKLADKNYNTLVISSDPAHTLSDAFRLPNDNHNNIDGEYSDMKRIIPRLYALQVDPIVEMNKKYSNILSYIASLFSSRGVDNAIAYEIAMMPGMTQLFSLLRIEEVMRTKNFDAIVLDMPASGEALRYLYFPKLIGSIGRKLTGIMGFFSGFSKMLHAFSSVPVSDRMIQYEHELFERLRALSDIIRDNNITSMRLIANPDTFSIENAKRTFMSASLYGINVDLALINKIMPLIEDSSLSSKYYREWAKFQNTKVQEARANFYPLPTKEVPLYSSELAGIEMLRINAHSIFTDDEDPANIFYRGKPFSITQDAPNNLRVAIKVPFTEKENLDIRRSGTEAIIKVKSPTGYIVNVIPLPVITFNMKMLRAKLDDNNMLNIYFKK